MKRIYTAVFRPWHQPYAWFGRDSGLVTEGLRQIGVESRLVILDTPGMDADERFLPASRSQFCDPSFWKALHLDAVILQGGGDIGVDVVSKAIKESGTRLFLRLDTDGVVAPQVDTYLYFYNLWWWLAFHKKRPAWLFALGKSALKTAFPKKFGPGRIINRLQFGDGLLIESRVAASRLRRLLCQSHAQETAHKIIHLPIPISDEWQFDPKIEKENLIISVGRWDDPQKDAPKLIKTLGKLLPFHPEYKALVIGNNESGLRMLVKKFARNSSEQIQITGRIPHKEIFPYEQRSKIYLCSSRAEGMSLAPAEALCCGCSVVGPAEIACIHDYAFFYSGTMAWTRRTNDFADALSAEIDEWKHDRRSPEEISARARTRFSSQSIAKALVLLVEGKKFAHSPSNP